MPLAALNIYELHTPQAHKVKGAPPPAAIEVGSPPYVSQDDVDLLKASASVPRNQRRSADNSPLHPHNYQAKLGAKGINGVSAGSSEGNHGLAPLTPVRSRMKSTPRGNETPDMVASVPKFGEWDANDPSSADGYTGIFNQVRAERQGGAGSTLAISANGHSLSKRLLLLLSMGWKMILSEWLSSNSFYDLEEDDDDDARFSSFGMEFLYNSVKL
ncbi:hypothetical protein V2J09_024056 [Rumex salicifolius]